MFENVLNEYYKRKHVNVEDLISPLHMALEVMIRKLKIYEADGIYLQQKDVTLLWQYLHDSQVFLEEFERRLSPSFDEQLQLYQRKSEAL